MTGGKNCGKREILFRIMDHHWVNLWECIYKFCIPGGTVRSLVLNNTDLYKASISLFFYILFKRGKQYAFIYLGAYLLQPWIFLYSFAFCMAFFFGSMLSLQIVQMGIKGLVLVFMSLFPHFICYVITLLLLIKRNFYAQKKEEMLYEQRHSFLFRFSIWFEITFIILGCILESFINPSIMSGILNLWK